MNLSHKIYKVNFMEGAEVSDVSYKFSLRDIRDKFVEHFVDYGCKKERPAKLSAGIDSTVIFVGSTTNTFKNYITRGKIPPAGLVVDQPSIRCRETSGLFDRSYQPNYGAFFNEIGVITQPKKSRDLCQRLGRYFTDVLGIPQDDLLVRVSSADADLCEKAKACFKHIEEDTRKPAYYRHDIGEKGYEGRNFNIAIKNKTSGVFEDVGNFLSFSKQGKDSFLEIGLGDTVIHKALMGRAHVLDCYDVKAPEKEISRIEQLNYVNSVIVCSVLFREGLVFSNKTSQDRILSKYGRYLSLLIQENKIDYNDIKDSVISFEKNYHADLPETTMSGVIVSDLRRKENDFQKTLREQKCLKP